MEILEHVLLRCLYLRLAFAVAAHLEPEILVVDEVLAVGDATFQKKCMGKMKDVSRSNGRTVLFVSHNTGAIQSLCSCAILIEQGRKAFAGSPQDAVRFYLREAGLKADVQDTGEWLRTGTGEARILSVRLENDAGEPQVQFCMGEALVIVVKAHFAKEIQNPVFGFDVFTDTGVKAADCRSSHYGLRPGGMKGTVEYRMRIDSLALYPRRYFVEPWISDATCLFGLDYIRNAATFIVTSGPNFLSGANLNGDHGVAFIPTSWSLSKG